MGFDALLTTPSFSVTFARLASFSSILLFYNTSIRFSPTVHLGAARGRRRGPSMYILRDLAPHPRTSFFHPPHPIDQGYASTDALVGRECRGRPHCRPRQTGRRRIRRLQSVTAASRAPPIYEKHTSLTIGARGSWLSLLTRCSLVGLVITPRTPVGGSSDACGCGPSNATSSPSRV